jgi:pimeloyl-ACP methyl ester carboxylesterase
MPFHEKTITTRGGLRIFTESIGDIKNPPLLLIMGAMNQGIFWYDSLCELLAKGEFFVIRYDHRDTGRSSVVDFSISPYTLDDMAQDALAILDAHSIEKAHLVGLSMGGYIAQIIGAKFPARTASLTLISTTADHRPYMDATTTGRAKVYDLPYPLDAYIDYVEAGKRMAFADADALNTYILDGWRLLMNGASDADVAVVKKLIVQSQNRSTNASSPFNHAHAVANTPERTKLVGNITAPTFIIHGAKDPCFPPAHAHSLHSLIPHSTLTIEHGMGHMFTPTQSAHLAEALKRNIRSIA